MDAEKMLTVRRNLHGLYEEALSKAVMCGFDDEDLDIEWPYESFFTFGSVEARRVRLTAKQWYRLLLGEDTDWGWDEFDECQDQEWAVAVGLRDDSPYVVVYLDLVETDNEFSAAEFWSLDHWCYACRVDIADATSYLNGNPSLRLFEDEKKESAGGGA